MKLLYLDCFAGISGDMTIGALLDLGLDFAYLQNELAKLGVAGYELGVERVDRSGINATKFNVTVAQTVSLRVSHTHTHDHSHSHEHSHGDASQTSSLRSHEHDHRSLSTIKHLIESSTLSEKVKRNATAIFQRIGEAEAKIHGVDIESVHFHEVGAIDSIVDIVGACIGLEALGIEHILSSPLHVGYGTFTCAHGTYPIPGPAATEILCGVPIYANNIEGELVTPTGAAIVATLAKDFVKMPMMRVEKVGYGAGTRIYEKFPNVLRAVLGKVEVTDATPDTITVIEANLDDLNPQVFGHLMEQVLGSGALDIFYTPVQMKKNRPGVLLTVLCTNETREQLMNLIFCETTTLGLRYREERRVILRREFVLVETAFGPINIKIARNQAGQVMNAAPEFDDCHAAALKHQVAVREVQLDAMNAYARK